MSARADNADARALAAESCEACRPESRPVGVEAAAKLLDGLPDWAIHQAETERLAATFTFPDFAAALAFANRVGALAEAADHHPMLVVEWGRVRVCWWTHAIGGLHRNDFVLAARTSLAAAGHSNANEV